MDRKSRFAVLWHWLRNPGDLAPADRQVEDRLNRAEERLQEITESAEERQRVDRVDAALEVKEARARARLQGRAGS